MEDDKLFLSIYEQKDETEWDEFIQKKSINGTFLQMRRFLNYHPTSRFADASCIVRNSKEEIVAVCPACLKTEGDQKILYSHMGSTYGGIIIDEAWYKAHKLLHILEFMENKWREEGIDQVVLKQTPSIFARTSQDLMEYCFYYLGYSSHKELNLYVDFDRYNDDILSEFTRRKRRNIYACEKAGCTWRKINSIEEVNQFHRLLSMTLEKYGKNSVHTVEELYDFISERLQKECEIYGIYKDEEMIAGSMIFYFHHAQVAHTQYLCANPKYDKISPMSYTYYAMLCEMKKKGLRKVSWGIVTEDLGRYLNDGLVDSKEAFGSSYGLNLTYQKKIGL